METKEIGLSDDEQSTTMLSKSTANPDLKQEKNIGNKENGSHKHKLITQALMILLFVCLGMSQLLGPTLPDIRSRLDVNYQTVSRAMILDTIGLVTGNIIGGALYDQFAKYMEYILVINFFIMGAGIIIIPWAPNIIALAVFLMITSIGKGGIDTGGNIMVMRVWGKNAAVPLHSLHLGFGIGALLAPQVAWPFLSVSMPHTSEDIRNGSSGQDEHLDGRHMNNDTFASMTQSRIEIPFALVGFICILCAFGFLIYHICSSNHRGMTNTERSGKKECIAMFYPNMCDPEQPIFALLLLITLFFFFAHIVGGEVAFGMYILSYATEKENAFSNAAAGLLNSLYFGGYTFGRAVATIVSRYIHPNYMMLLIIIFLMIISIILAVFAYTSNPILWLFSVLLGMFQSILFPSGLTWTNYYLKTTAMAIMVLLLGSGAGAICYNYTTAFLFDSYGPNMLMYVILSSNILILITYAGLQVLLFARNKNTFKRSADEVHEDYEIPEILTPDVTEDKHDPNGIV